LRWRSEDAITGRMSLSTCAPSAPSRRARVGQHFEQDSQIAIRSAERTENPEVGSGQRTPRPGNVPVSRDQSVGCLEPEDPVQSGWLTDRVVDVAANLSSSETTGDGYDRTTR
jgi:hypothetical protein